MCQEKIENATDLQKEFDTYIKKTIKLVINNVLRTYVNSEKRQRNMVYVADPNEYAFRGKHYDHLSAGPDPDREEYFQDERLLAGLASLGEKHRRVIELTFLEMIPNEGIAELMELSEKTVRNYKSAALGILKRYLEDGGNEG